jgi:hypothetical protein
MLKRPQQYVFLTIGRYVGKQVKNVVTGCEGKALGGDIWCGSYEFVEKASFLRAHSPFDICIIENYITTNY